MKVLSKVYDISPTEGGTASSFQCMSRSSLEAFAVYLCGFLHARASEFVLEVAICTLCHAFLMGLNSYISGVFGGRFVLNILRGQRNTQI